MDHRDVKAWQKETDYRYDVVISRGGLTCLVTGASLAGHGYKVAIVERRSTLGWEIARARRVFVRLHEAQGCSTLV